MLRNNGRHNFRSPYFPQPSLVLDFAGTGTLDPRVTFTRSTTGTYYNSSGVLTTAAIDAPRFDYNPSTLAPLGLLIEQSSTNLLLQSQAYNNGYWGSVSTTASDNSVISPDGTTNASKITLGVSGANALFNATGISVIPSTTYTFSFYALRGTATDMSYAAYNLSAASFIISSTSYYSSTNSSTWSRITVSIAIPSNCTSLRVYISSNSASTGNFYVWGAQLEALAFPTSYIPTTSAQVTRAVDDATMTGTNFSSWYNNGQGTLYAEFKQILNALTSGNRSAFIVDSGSYTNAMSIGVGGGQNQSSISSTIGNTSITLANGSTTTGTSYKIALSYAPNNFAGCTASGTVQTSSSGNVPTGVNEAIFGYYPTGGTYMNGWIKKLAYYPQAVTSAQLQALTGS